MKSFLILAALAAAALSFAAPPSGVLAPAADHHTHIMSPTAVKLVNDPPLPEIEVPAELAKLLRAKEKGWNDKAALEKLYTEDSILFDFRETRWIKGRDEVTDYM